MMALSVTPNETLDFSLAQNVSGSSISAKNMSTKQNAVSNTEKSSGENSFLSVLKSASKDTKNLSAAKTDTSLNSENLQASRAKEASRAEESGKTGKTEKVEKSEKTSPSDKTQKSTDSENKVSEKKDVENASPVEEKQLDSEEYSQAAEAAAEAFVPAFVEQELPEENQITMEIDVVEQTSSMDLSKVADNGENIAENLEIAAETAVATLEENAKSTETSAFADAVIAESEAAAVDEIPAESFEEALGQTETPSAAKTSQTKNEKKAVTEEESADTQLLAETETLAASETEIPVESLAEMNQESNSSKNESKSEENPIKVVDLRTQSPEEESQPTEVVQQAPQVQENHTEQQTVNFTANVQQNITASSDQTAQASGSTFQQMVNQQVEHNIPEFVKAGSIVLKDNNQGSIKLNLKPEALGNVKFDLQISDNKITGEITVASKEALEAFKQNLEQLKVAFQQSGFENATLNLNLADNSSNFNQNGQQEGGEKFKANKAYGDYGVAQGDAVESEPSGVYFDGSDYKVNVVA